jgi:hypothetical protein
LKFPREWSRTERTEITKKRESTTGLKQTNGLISGPSARRTKGSVEIKQRKIKVDSRTIYMALSYKRTPFQIGIDG